MLKLSQRRGTRDLKSNSPEGQKEERTDMKLYIYSNETNEHVATVTGDDNRSCEQAAQDAGYLSGDFGNTYSPAFGFSGGLTEENPDAVEIVA